MPNGLGGEPGQPDVDRDRGADAAGGGLAAASSPPLTASVPAAITTFGSGIAVVGRAQRAAHAARPAPVTSSTSACRGLAVKNTPEPVRCRRPGRAGPGSPTPRCRRTRRPRAGRARCGAARGSVRPAGRGPPATAASVSGSSGTISCPRVNARRRARSRPPTRRTRRAARPRTGRTGCTGPGQPARCRPVGRDGAGRAQRPSRSAEPARVGRRRGDAAGPAPGVGVGVRPGGPAGGDHAVAQAAQHPDAHSATPATDRPKLASMNGKSVRMSPANTSCISTRLWNDADRGWHPAIRPALQRNVVEHLALRRLGPADRAAAGRLAGDPELIGGPFGQKIVGGPPEQTERLVHLLPPDPQPGQRVARPCGAAGFACPATCTRRTGGPAGRRRRTRPPCRSGPAHRAARARAGRQRPGAAQPVQERGGGHQRGGVRGRSAVPAGPVSAQQLGG